MNNVKHLKPNLLDPIIEQRIKKTLMPKNTDYWGPVKNTSLSFWKDVVLKNIGLIVLVVLIILFLIYRYRVIRKVKESNVEPYVSKSKILPNNDNTRLFLEFYNQQKEILREPKIKNSSGFAYPMYPYSKGDLVSSERKG